MDIAVTRFVRFENQGALQAFCDVSVGSAMLIKGVRVVEGRTGPFVSMPRQQNSIGKWYDNVVLLDGALREKLIRRVLEAYRISQQTSEAGIGGSTR